MTAATTTNSSRIAGATARGGLTGDGQITLNARVSGAARRLFATFGAPRRARHTRTAFRDAYAALQRLDQRVLVDIGIRPEQLTAFVQAATSRPTGRDLAAGRGS